MKVLCSCAGKGGVDIFLSLSISISGCMQQKPSMLPWQPVDP